VEPVSDPYRWDERVGAWDEVAATESFLAIRDRIVELAQPRIDDYAVDLGAGTGLLALALAPRVRELVAVDISEQMLARLDDAAAADGVHNVEPVIADLRRLPLEDESATPQVSGAHTTRSRGSASARASRSSRVASCEARSTTANSSIEPNG
jgi:SAM-dependent methyltransferase